MAGFGKGTFGWIGTSSICFCDLPEVSKEFDVKVVKILFQIYTSCITWSTWLSVMSEDMIFFLQVFNPIRLGRLNLVWKVTIYVSVKYPHDSAWSSLAWPTLESTFKSNNCRIFDVLNFCLYGISFSFSPTACISLAFNETPQQQVSIPSLFHLNISLALWEQVSYTQSNMSIFITNLDQIQRAYIKEKGSNSYGTYLSRWI